MSDPEEVGVHVGGEQGAGHQDACMDAVEDRSAEDARIEEPVGELPLVPRDDEPQDALALVPPPGEELRDLRKTRRHTATRGVLASEREALDEGRVVAPLAPLPTEALLDHIEELLLLRHAFRAQRRQEPLRGLRDADELLG